MHGFSFLLALAFQQHWDRLHGNVKDSDRGWGAPGTIMVEGEPHYAVMYGNVQLAGEDQRRYKNIRRRMGITKSGKGGNAQPGVRVPADFETRAKYKIAQQHAYISVCTDRCATHGFSLHLAFAFQQHGDRL